MDDHNITSDMNVKEPHYHQNKQRSRKRKAVQSPPADAEDESNDKIDNAHTNTNEQGEDYETADMNLVKHLCSTTIDLATGLPVQKLTVMCGESGEIMMSH